MRALRRWKTGWAVAVVSFVIGAVRLLATGDTDWLTWVWFVIAAAYAFAALVARRLLFPERAVDVLGRPERRPRFAALLGVGEPRDRPGPDSNLVQRVRSLQHGTEETVTRNRIANALATGAAIVGMVLVFTGAGQAGQDNGSDAPARPGHVAPVVPGPIRPGVPAPTQAPARTRAPTPASEKDGAGDDDG